MAPHSHDDTPPSLLARLIKPFAKRNGHDSGLREAIEEYIEEPEELEADPVARHERALLSNILDLRDVRVHKVMVPRADIIAIDVDTPQEELFALLSEKQASRIPVYKETLDDVLGTIHLKDIIETLSKGDEVNIADMITEAPIVSPSMPILDLLMTMRDQRRHMAMVVDEYGGIDGLVTIGDVIESIVGEIDDEHDEEDAPQVVRQSDGALLVDARMDIEEFEEEFGAFSSEDEREENDTLGGLAFMLAGRVPARGEILTHESGTVFEVIEADQRRISRLKIRNLPPADKDAA